MPAVAVGTSLPGYDSLHAAQLRSPIPSIPPLSILPPTPPSSPLPPKEETPLPSQTGGIPLPRHRAKLEECAALHRQLHTCCAELSLARESLGGARREGEALLAEIIRLRDVLHTTTAELHASQRRVEELELANLQLRAGRHGGVGVGSRPPAGASLRPVSPHRLQFYRSPSLLAGGLPPLPCGSGSPRFRPTPVDADAAPVCATNPTDGASSAMAAYVRESFRAGVLPHMELLHSLYAGGRLVAVAPPVTFAQWAAMARVLRREVGGAAAAAAVGHAERLLSLRRLSQRAAAPTSWVAGVEFLSFACADWRAGVELLRPMLAALPAVRRVELFGVRDGEAMRRVAEALLMAVHVEAIALPELQLEDAGVEALFTLLERRARLATAPPGPTPEREGERGSGSGEMDELMPAVVAAEAEARRVREGVKALSAHCLDLSRCTITDPAPLLRAAFGESVEVLLLTGCAALRDAHVRTLMERCPRLHTLDLSGCVGLTTSCVPYISQHPHLKVLRLENCPSVKRLDLDNVEVLFASLAYVSALRAPALRRLPIPLTHSHVLFDFYAPQLTELTLRGIVVDHGTLAAFMRPTGANPVGGWEMDRPLSLLPTPSPMESRPPTRTEPEADALDGAETNPDADAAQTHEEPPQTPNPVPCLLAVGFLDCLIADAVELESFLRHQSHLLRLSLHGSKGVMDSHVAHFPPTLLELDLGGAAQLTGGGMDLLAARLTRLTRLSLKNAGPRVEAAAVRRLCGLTRLEELNLLLLPQLGAEVVAAVAAALPRLRVLFHETAIVGAAPSTAEGAVLQLRRADAEDTTQREVRDCAGELLQLRNATALALWMEAQLPKPAALLPARRGVDWGAPQPPLSAHTTYYEAAAASVSPNGTRGAVWSAASDADAARGTQSADERTREDSHPSVTMPGGEAEGMSPRERKHTPRASPDEEEEEDEVERAERAARRAAAARGDAEMEERGRLAVEKAPLGPWDEADIVAQHR